MSAAGVFLPFILSGGLGLQPAQPPGTSLIGVVEDSSGGVVAGATVTLTCLGDRRVVTADDDGRFTFVDPPSATCTVAADSPFFERAEQAIDLSTPERASLRIILQVQGFESQVVVTPGRGIEERIFNLPEAVSVTTRAELESRPHQLLPQVLKEEPGVLLQQTTTAHASPFIRGFSAQRIVYLLDGVRFNTSMFRSGATQYLGWISPQTVERLEVVRGPASVQYGSDALGGTVNVVSFRPPLSPTGPMVSGRVAGLAGSADLSAATEATALIQGLRMALQIGGSTRRVDDLRTGRGTDSHAAVTRFLGLGSDVLDTRLRNTGFRQRGLQLLARTKVGRGFLNTTYLHEQQFGVHRYDRELGGDGWHRAEFTPQRLDVALVQYEQPSAGRFDNLRLGFSLNRQQDDRLNQQRPTSRLERETTRVLAIGYQAQATTRVGERHALTFGGEFYDEHIAAARAFDDPAAAGGQAVRPRVPDGTTYGSLGFFIQDATALIPGRLSLRGGLRYGRFTFRTVQDDTFGVDDARVTTDSVTFHSGAVVRLRESLNATFTASRGFRAANAIDLGAIGLSGGGFEISPRVAAGLDGEVGSSDGLEAVGTGRAVGALGPETLFAFEAGLKLQTDRINAAVNVFDLELSDIIQRRVTVFGQSVVGTVIAGYEIVRQDAEGRAYVAEDPRPIVTRVNVDRARVRGLEGTIAARLTPAWRTGGYFSMARGREIGSGLALRRMPPPLGGLHVRFEPVGGNYWIEGTAQFAWRQTRLSPGDLTDARIGAIRSRDSIADFFTGTATDLGLVVDSRLVATGESLADVQQRVLGGASNAPLFTSTPGFFIVGARVGVALSDTLELTVLSENLTDRNYRWHGSGVDGPGVNVQVRVGYRF